MLKIKEWAQGCERKGKIMNEKIIKFCEDAHNPENTSENIHLMGKMFVYIFYSTLAVNIYILLRFSIADFYVRSGFGPIGATVRILMGKNEIDLHRNPDSFYYHTGRLSH